METTHLTAPHPTDESVQNRLFMSPMIRKLTKVQLGTQGTAASYRGITLKTCYFLAMIFGGAGLYFALQPMLAGSDFVAQSISFSWAGAGVLTACGFFVLATPLLAFLLRALLPVTGTLYSASVGYLIAFVATAFDELASSIWLALWLTVAVVAIMAWLYASGIVKVGQKFRTVIITLFAATLLSGLAGIVLAFIPQLKPLVGFLQQNAVVSIVSGIVFIIIAAMFLLVDFDTMHHIVENRLPRKYEWEAAFALSFTVIWLYLKILDLIFKAKGTNKK